VRVVEVKADGSFGRSLPAQFDPGPGYDGLADRKGTLVFMLPGRTPASQTIALRFVFRTSAGASPIMPLVSWDDKAHAISTPAYSASFTDGVIGDICDRLSSTPSKVAIRSIPVSSQITGWTTEEGKVNSVQVVSSGPVRVVVRVLKSLNGGFETDKTFSFYPRHFTLDYTVNKPGIMASRALLHDDGQFEDSGGTKAMMDGQGDDEGVSGRSQSPKWYADLLGRVGALVRGHDAVRQHRVLGRRVVGGIAFNTGRRRTYAWRTSSTPGRQAPPSPQPTGGGSRSRWRSRWWSEGSGEATRQSRWAGAQRAGWCAHGRAATAYCERLDRAVQGIRAAAANPPIPRMGH